MKGWIGTWVLPLLAWPLLWAPAHAGETPPAAPVHEVRHAQDHAGHGVGAMHAAGAVPAPAIDGARWTPDAPLREGMRRMAVALAALDHAAHGHLDAARTPAVAGEVEAAADFMFANCELAAEPDVVLHGLLARLLAGARALAVDPSDPAPVADMRAALGDYPRYFDDPGFPDVVNGH